MDLIDLIVSPFYIFILWMVARFIVNRYYINDAEEGQYVMWGMYSKLFGCIAFACVYQFYYVYGDTWGFYYWFYNFKLCLFDTPGIAIKFLFSHDKGDFYNFCFAPSNTQFVSKNVWGYDYILKYDTTEHFFIRLAAPINILGFNTYLGTSLLFATISFVGSWMMYTVFCDINRKMRREFAIAIFFIPSVLFWGSGILKDTITLAFTGVLTYTIYWGIIKRHKIIINVALLAFSIFMVGQIKGYIILAYVPAASYWIFSAYKDQIKLPVIRKLAAPILLMMGAGLMFVAFKYLGNTFGKFSLDQIQQTAKDFQSWHIVASEGGSGYTIGNASDFSTTGLIKKFPLAVNVTLFRPYLWEARNIVLLAAALESLAMSGFTIYILWKTKIVKLPIYFAEDSAIGFCLIFALIFAFSVGLTSFNFGALVRYKIPCVPFYGCAIVLLRARILGLLPEDD